MCCIAVVRKVLLDPRSCTNVTGEIEQSAISQLMWTNACTKIRFVVDDEDAKSVLTRDTLVEALGNR